MTVQADLIRDNRRQFAAPGGFHDRLIGLLDKALPAAIGVIAAVMILAPFTQRGEISFLLDRNKVAVTDERLAVDKAMYRGQDNQGRQFSLTAGSAIQAAPSVPVVEMKNLVGNIELADGPAKITAPSANYNFDTDQIQVPGPVNVTATGGYRMVTNGVGIDLKAHRLAGSGGVSGAVPSGVFSADRMSADLGERTITLEGRARLRMVPGELRMPK